MACACLPAGVPLCGAMAFEALMRSRWWWGCRTRRFSWSIWRALHAVVHRAGGATRQALQRTFFLAYVKPAVRCASPESQPGAAHLAASYVMSPGSWQARLQSGVLLLVEQNGWLRPCSTC